MKQGKSAERSGYGVGGQGQDDLELDPVHEAADGQVGDNSRTVEVRGCSDQDEIAAR